MKKSEQAAENAAFLAELLQTPAMAPAVVLPAATSVQSTTPITETRQRRAVKPGFYDKVWETVAHLVALFGAVLLWWIGAQFTLQFLGALGLNLVSLGLAQWLIPLGITGVELKFWPKEGLNRNLLAVFLFFAACDLGSSAIGGVQWAADRTLPKLGWQLPGQDSLVLWGLSLGLASICAFWPERLARAAITELRKLWKI